MQNEEILDNREKFCIKSENKRLESIKRKRIAYQQQKSAVQAALASLVSTIRSLKLIIYFL